jgi:hypothetical protein
MKTKLFFILFLLAFQNLFSQVYHGGYENIFFDRFAEAKNEAIGKILSVGNDSYFILFANPAINTNGKEVSAYYTNSSHYYLNNDFGFKYFGTTINIGDIGAFGFSMANYDWGKFYYMTSESPNGKEYNASEKLYTFSYANSIGTLINFGVEANLYVDSRRYDKTPKETFFTVGLSKNIIVSDLKSAKDIFITGLQTINIFGQGMEYENGTVADGGVLKSTDYFPSIIRIGVENEYSYFDNDIYSNSYLYRVRASLEYEDLLNYKYRTTYKLGAEISLLNIFSLRCGYFSSSLQNINNSRESLENFTYGAGLNLDFRELTKKIPFAFAIDYVSLEQPSYVTNINNWSNFNTIQARVRYFWD